MGSQRIFLSRLYIIKKLPSETIPGERFFNYIDCASVSSWGCRLQPRLGKIEWMACVPGQRREARK